tara:strand:+ start:369 stop:1562 length:1194 start_codon:yes stop_codon:yes gene_type:complete
MDAINVEECLKLREREHEAETPQFDVLLNRHDSWKKFKQFPPELIVKKDKIIMMSKNSEALITTPPFVAKGVCFHNDGISGYKNTSKYKNQYQCIIPKDNVPSETLDISLSVRKLFDENKEFYKYIENLVMNVMFFAFQQSELMNAATDFAWEHANMDSVNPEQHAFDIFMNRAKLPFDQHKWTVKKNVFKKGRNNYSKKYISIYDINNTEHTGNIHIENGAVLQLSMRLWPYHLSGDIYGISAQISKHGVKVYHAGGKIPARRKWKPHDYIINKDINRWKLLDVRGGSMKIHTPVVKVVSADTKHILVSIDRNKYNLFLKSIRKIETHVQENMGVKTFITPVKNKNSELSIIKFNAPPGTEWSVGDKNILILKNVLYKLPNDTGGMIWVLDKQTKI